MCLACRNYVFLAWNSQVVGHSLTDRHAIDDGSGWKEGFWQLAKVERILVIGRGRLEDEEEEEDCKTKRKRRGHANLWWIPHY